MNVGAVERDRGVGAVEPAEQAVHALREVDLRLDARAPAAGLAAARPRRGRRSHRDGSSRCLLVARRRRPRGSAPWSALRPSSSTARLLQASRAAARRARPRRAPTMKRFVDSRGAPSSAASRSEPARLQARRHVGLVQQRRLEHDDDVGRGDRVVPADRLVVVARERAKRRAAALGPVLGERLHALARLEQRDARAAATPSSRPGRRARASGSPSRPASEERVDAARRELRLAHGLDDRRAAVHRVARGEPARVRRPAALVDGDRPWRELEPVDPARAARCAAAARSP